MKSPAVNVHDKQPDIPPPICPAPATHPTSSVAPAILASLAHQSPIHPPPATCLTRSHDKTPVPPLSPVPPVWLTAAPAILASALCCSSCLSHPGSTMAMSTCCSSHLNHPGPSALPDSLAPPSNAPPALSLLLPCMS